MDLVNPINCYYAYPCNRFLLVHFFLGACTVMMGWQCFYVLTAWLAGFALLQFHVWSITMLLDSLLHAVLGLAFGAFLRYALRHSSLLFTGRALKRHRSTLVSSFQYLIGALPFISASLAIEETGFPYGIVLTIIFFWMWSCFVWFLNQRKIKRLSQGDSEFTAFNRSLAALTTGMSVVLLVAWVPVYNDYVAVSLGTVAAVTVVWLVFKDLTPIKRR